jgi:hypothetical protein
MTMIIAAATQFVLPLHIKSLTNQSIYYIVLLVGQKKYEFVCKDKDGIQVFCTADDWKHIIKHKECDGRQDLIKTVIENPDSIFQDADHKDRKVFYKISTLPEPWGDCFIRVVIKYGITIIKKRAWVCTAFASYDKKKGEWLLWTK